MKRRVYRSLDRPASVFGVRGRFLYVTLLGGSLALVIGLAVGGAGTMIAGLGTGLAAALAAYLLTLCLQSKVDEKDLLKTIVKRSYPTLYRVRPKHVRNIWRGFNLPVNAPAKD